LLANLPVFNLHSEKRGATINGFKLRELFVRVAYNLSDKWAVAIEEYDGFGPLRDFVPSNWQFHETWAVIDRKGGFLNVETGVGVGWSGGADKLTLKLMLSRDLYSQIH
jgi:hypothetical protein